MNTDKKDFAQTNTLRIDIQRSNLRRQAGMGADERREDPNRTQTLVVEQGLFVELLENVYDAVVIAELDGHIVKTNRRAQDYFQYTREEFFRLNFLDLISGAADSLLQTARDYLKNQQHVFIEAYSLRRDGSFFPCEITGNLLHLYETEHLCFFFRNVTVKKEAEEALRNAQKELLSTAHSAGMATIATGVLHDVGNILNSISVSSDLILERLQQSGIEALEKVTEMLTDAGEKAGEFIASDPRGKRIPELYRRLGKSLREEHDLIQDEMHHLRKKLDTIRDVIQMQQSYAKAGLFMERVSLIDLVEDALALQRAVLEQQQIQVVRDYGEGVVVTVQKAKLIHVFTNLICNAVEAMKDVPPEKRILTLETGKNEENVFFRVADTGEGISAENLKKIFTHGFTTKEEGHGFGLHACANFMTEMGGRIIAQSHGKNAGAVFTLLFPLAENKTVTEAERGRGG